MNPPPLASSPSAAVIGAGIAGLACARALADAGWRVRVFEKSRGPGGRSATRRSDSGSFDHGAQYFTVRDATFGRTVAAWAADAVVAPWSARVVRLEGSRATPIDAAARERQVGVPGMSALGRALSRGLDLAFECTIVRAARDPAGWRLDAACAPGPAPRGLPERWDWLVCAAPSPQSAALLAEVPSLAADVAARTMVPCWALMVDFQPHPDTGWDAAFVDDPRVAWAAREASRPGRPPGFRWVVHATSAWSRDHLEDDPAHAATRLLEAFRERSGITAPAPAVRAHRWRYARPDDALPTLPERSLLDAAARAGACGDWAGGGRIEDAWLSGRALAARVLDAANAGR